jgi:hypothetical protein
LVFFLSIEDGKSEADGDEVNAQELFLLLGLREDDHFSFFNGYKGFSEPGHCNNGRVAKGVKNAAIVTKESAFNGDFPYKFTGEDAEGLWVKGSAADNHLFEVLLDL